MCLRNSRRGCTVPARPSAHLRSFRIPRPWLETEWQHGNCHTQSPDKDQRADHGQQERRPDRLEKARLIVGGGGKENRSEDGERQAEHVDEEGEEGNRRNHENNGPDGDGFRWRLYAEESVRAQRGAEQPKQETKGTRAPPRRTSKRATNK